MSTNELLLKEQCGSLGDPVKYFKSGQNDIILKYESSADSLSTSLIQTGLKVIRELLLPYGYPDSVSKDYLEYQLWDTIQAFCSTITGIFTTQAVLKGVGVGDAEASALSATITWIVKDGTGMVGRIVFAWWKGHGLDCDCKKWRLFADIVNDGAMVLELCIPYASHLSTYILCMSTAMKSVVGVAGGATRASITNHQAIKGNMAEISAKDGSQETLVNLIASIVGIILINYFTNAEAQWFITVMLVIIHIYSNYQAVTVLVFKILNNMRMTLVLRNYLTFNSVSTPEKINAMESVLLGFGERVEQLCGFQITMGRSLKTATSSFSFEGLKALISVYENKKYLLVPDMKKRKIYVAFEKGETSEDVIAAYYSAVLLSAATCMYNNVPLNMFSEDQMQCVTPITKLRTFMKKYPSQDNSSNLPSEVLSEFAQFADRETDIFLAALKVNGWKTDTHSLYLDEWRSQWKDSSKKLQ